MYSLDPLKDGVLICHSEGHKRGIASNHGDVMHWFPKHGKSMDTFRKDVAAKLKGGSTDPLAQYKANVQKKTGLSDGSMDYLSKCIDAYKYAEDMWKKISNAMK
jgi:hypothetical protein